MAEMIMDMPSMTVNIKIATPRGYRLRLKLLAMALSVASFVAPPGVTVESGIKADD